MTKQSLSRRKLLALTAATVTAGCGGKNSSDGGMSGRFAENSSTASAPQTSTVTITEDSSSVEINIDTETETEQVPENQETTERPTETPEETSTPSGTDRLERARQHLEESIAVYTDVENVNSVEEVDASVTGFDAAAVREELSAAKTELDRAAEFRDVDEQAIAELRAARTTIAELVACQEAVMAAYEQYDRAVTAVYSEEFNTASNALSKLDLKSSQAANQLSSFERTAASDLSPVSAISAATYDAKVSQFDAEITGFEESQSPIENVNDGLEQFAEGVDRYVDGDYRGAQRDFVDANGFGIAYTTLLQFQAPDAIRETTEKLRRASKAFDDGISHLIEACRDGRDGREREQRSDFNDAMSAFRGSGSIYDLPSFTQLTDET